MRRCFLFSLSLFLMFLCLGTPASGQAVPGGDTGYFLIDSDPGDAQVIMDGIYRGNTPITVPVSITATPSHTITVSKTGFFPFAQTFPPPMQAGQTQAVYAVLERSTDTGTLIVTTSPQGALITIDGGMGQQAPWTYADLSAGSHVVRAFLSGYQPFLTLVTIPPQGTVTADVQLVLLSRTGILQVTSSPGGADIYIDGFYSGYTSATIGNLAAGPHYVQLRLAGYQEWAGTINVPENGVATISEQLIVPPVRTTGDLVIASEPPGASVSLDGVYKGNTQAGDLLDLTGILPGTYTLLLQLTNYQDFTSSVEVQAGRVTRVNAELVAAAYPSRSGTLLITSDPQGANIFLDNSCIGITPLTIPSVEAGTHSLVLRLPGYSDYASALSVAPGQAVQIHGALSPVPTTTGQGILPLAGAGVVVLFFMGRKR